MLTEKFPATKISQGQLASLVEQFDASMPRASAATRHVYKKGLNQLLAFAKTYPFKFTPDDFSAFRLWLFNHGKLSRNTVNVYLTASRRFCEYLTELEILKKNPAWSVHGSAQEFKILKVKLTEVAAAISNIDRSSILGKRDFVFLSAILESGASISELIKANVGDLKKHGKYARLYVKKGFRPGDSEIILFSSSVTAAMYNYLEARTATGTEGPLFTTVRGGKGSNVRLSLRGVRAAMQKHLKFGDSRRIRIDSLRTYCAVRLMSRGKSSDEVRSIMRFKSNMPFRKIIYNMPRGGVLSPDK